MVNKLQISDSLKVANALPSPSNLWHTDTYEWINDAPFLSPIYVL